ncbi:MAG: LysR substrate-binding domain-containing protein [Amaricoccus sp.]|uniref:LysR family transcriptional regulator n=1 Tax=Amaricoccus sp. TaxID=1872485 RepID=UPI003315091F
MLHQIDLSRADLNLLVLFEIVMEERHVGRAARRLNLSPSAVSHGLGRLRVLLGDPLFLRMPRGVVPTDRARDLAGPIAEVLARVRGVLASATPFDPTRSTRRFVIGAPDGASATFLGALLDRLAADAPGVAIGVPQLLPRGGDVSVALAWSDALADLDARALDIAIIPHDDFPARFARRSLYTEDFVIAARAGHPFLREPSLDAYRAARHLVVSQSGDPRGFVDDALADQGAARLVALTVPNFLFALAELADSDLISALPRRFAAMHGPRFGVAHVEPPIALPRFDMSLVTPRPALMDAGLAWMAGLVEAACRSHAVRSRGSSSA